MTLRKKQIETRATTDLANPIRLVWLLLLMSVTSFAQQPNLVDESLEDLMDIQVSSVSKKEQKLSRTASAVFVITAEDIRRSGATNIPDLLRMVPGVDVAQIDANTWAVSARGLNGRFSNELLVMLDGRNVYTPTFGGVFWDVLDLPFEDIERIEVVRGPGGTIWGANAVNGVINIITKQTAGTKGGLVVGGGGNLDQGFGTVQFGGGLGENTDFRIFTKYFNQYHMPGLADVIGADSWHLLRAGFRTDSQVSAHDTLIVEGDTYTGREGITASLLTSVTSPATQDVAAIVPLSGGFLYSAWHHTYSNGSDSNLQISFDRYKRDDVLMERRNTLAVDFQHHFARGTRQDLVWGANYRNTNSHTHGNLDFSLSPANVNMQLFSLFLQDEIALVPDKLYLTIGTRLDHNYYTGFNLSPSARAAWTPHPRQMFWAAISRAHVTPAETDTGIRINLAGIPGSPPTLLALIGNPHFDDQGLTAYEAGYRTALFPSLSIDLVAYYNAYDHQRTTEPGTPFLETSPAPSHLVVPLTYENMMHGEGHGFEIAANWKVTDHWLLSPGYAFEGIHMHMDGTSQDMASITDHDSSSPPHNAQFRSHVDLQRTLGWDVSCYFVDRIMSEIPAYTRLDTHLTWHVTERASMSLVGQNLWKDRHLEFMDDQGSLNSTLIKRSGYIKFTWQF